MPCDSTPPSAPTDPITIIMTDRTDTAADLDTAAPAGAVVLHQDDADHLELDQDGRPIGDLTRPDEWLPGLRASVKVLNTRTVSRAGTPQDVPLVALQHNLRDGNEDHRHRHPIDASRTPANTVLRGPTSAAVGAELVQSILDELGIAPARRDTIMMVEHVVQAEDGGDTPAVWLAALEWLDTKYQHVVSAVVHRDQTRPHMHALSLAVADGKLAGHALTSGDRGLTRQRFDLLHHLRDALGLRADRAAPKLDPLARLALTTGKGARTHAAAARRDAELARLNAVAAEMGIGVDGHRGSADAMGVAVDGRSGCPGSMGVAVDGRSGINSGMGVAVDGRSGWPENRPLRPPTADLASFTGPSTAPSTELLVPAHAVAAAVAETETRHAAELARLRLENDRLNQRLHDQLDRETAAEARAAVAAVLARRDLARARHQVAILTEARQRAEDAALERLDAEHAPVMVTVACEPLPAAVEVLAEPAEALNQDDLRTAHDHDQEPAPAPTGGSLKAARAAARDVAALAGMAGRGWVTQAEVAAMIAVSVPTAADTLRRLVAAGRVDDRDGVSDAGRPRAEYRLAGGVKAATTVQDARDDALLVLLVESGDWLTRSEILRYAAANGHAGWSALPRIGDALQALTARGLVKSAPSGKAFRHDPVPHYTVTDAGRARALA
jgi:hypothetical protein